MIFITAPRFLFSSNIERNQDGLKKKYISMIPCPTSTLRPEKRRRGHKHQCETALVTLLKNCVCTRERDSVDGPRAWLAFSFRACLNKFG